MQRYGFLSVTNMGGGALSIAISNIDNSPKINHVTATAAFGVESHGIHNSNALADDDQCYGKCRRPDE